MMMCSITSQRGIALLMVLWVLTILMVTVLSFSFMARTETQSTLSFKEEIEKKFIAEAAIERTIVELFYRRQNMAAEGIEIWRADGTSYNGQVGEGHYIVRIRGESGKLDINTVPDIILKNLLLNAGVNEADADIIVDSIMDWKDADDLHRLHGAESDYYMSMPHPYKAKNADFETLEELLLVKGITPALLYGTAERKGIVDFLTVNAKSSININYAPKEVLMALPGITAEVADRIIQYRKDKIIKNIQEIQDILGENYKAASPYINIMDTNVFTIDATGHKGNEKAGYFIKATVIIDGNNKYRYLYYKSPAYGMQR